MYNDFYENIHVVRNIHGEPVEKTQRDYPYSYDAYCIYKSDNWSPNDSGDYSDRLMQWDYNKFGKCMKEVWGNNAGQYFTNKDPKDVEKFLSLYHNKKIELTGIEQACNQWNGYPYWIFYYKDKEK